MGQRAILDLLAVINSNSNSARLCQCIDATHLSTLVSLCLSRFWLSVRRAIQRCLRYRNHPYSHDRTVTKGGNFMQSKRRAHPFCRILVSIRKRTHRQRGLCCSANGRSANGLWPAQRPLSILRCFFYCGNFDPRGIDAQSLSQIADEVSFQSPPSHL